MDVVLKIFLAACAIASVSVSQAQQAVSDGTQQKVSAHAVYGLTEYNFGTVAEGTIVRAEFPIKNTGEDNLTFTKTVLTCGCTVINGIDKPLLPDAETKLAVTFDTTGYTGTKARTISVQTNDPDHPTQVFELKGSVTSQISMQPPVVNFGEVTQGVQTKKTLVVKTGVNGIHFGQVTTTAHGVTVSQVKHTASELDLEVALSDAMPLGELRDRIVIEVVGYREPSLSVPIYAFVKGSVRVQPPQISFGLVSPGSLLRRRLKLEQYGKDGFNILGTKSSTPAVSLTARQDSDKKHYTVEVVLDPSKVTSDVRGSVTIETDLANAPEITIPVYAIAAAAK